MGSFRNSAGATSLIHYVDFRCLFAGNYYGTPKPAPRSSTPSPHRTSSPSADPLLPGKNPSSKGKRERNRSNVEAMTAKLMSPPAGEAQCLPADVCSEALSDAVLGPLPDYWEKSFTETGEPYFIEWVISNRRWKSFISFNRFSNECCMLNLAFLFQCIF